METKEEKLLPNQEEINLRQASLGSAIVLLFIGLTFLVSSLIGPQQKEILKSDSVPSKKQPASNQDVKVHIIRQPASSEATKLAVPNPTP